MASTWSIGARCVALRGPVRSDAARTDAAHSTLRTALGQAASAADAEAERRAAEELYSAIDTLLPLLSAEANFLTAAPDPIADLHATAALDLLQAARTRRGFLRVAARSLEQRLVLLRDWREERGHLEPWLHSTPSRAEYTRACRESLRLQTIADTADCELRALRPSGVDEMVE